MHAKNNRQNKDFQIAYFLAGSCHTPDGAYSLLCDLREDRRNALANAEVVRLREQARRAAAVIASRSADEYERLNGEADLLELDSMAATAKACYDAAVAELATIEKCIERLQPLRKFAHLPDPEAHEAAQHDEWKFELIHRAENSLLSCGVIPVDQWATLRMHPAFATEILPAIEKSRTALMHPDSARALLTSPARLADLTTMLLDAPRGSTTTNPLTPPDHESKENE